MRVLVAIAAFFAVLFTMGTMAPAESDGFSRCLKLASRSSQSPAERDEARTLCLQKFKDILSFPACFRVARGFEYSINAEEMKSLCTLDLKQDPTPQQCATAAASMQYADNREALLWSCLQRLNLTMNSRDCHKLARLMVYPHQVRRATSYCSEEIRSSVK